MEMTTMSKSCATCKWMMFNDKRNNYMCIHRPIIAAAFKAEFPAEVGAIEAQLELYGGAHTSPGWGEMCNTFEED